MKSRALALLLTLMVVGGIAHDARSEPEPPQDHRKPPPVDVPGYPPGTLTSAAVGYLPGSGDVSQTGEFTYSIPLDVPAGRAGMQPSLSLRYSSRGGDGMLGTGWSLTGPSSIYRCPKTLAAEGITRGVDYYLDTFCIDGERLVAVSGPYGEDGTEYRTERDQFARVISWGGNSGSPASFEVWDREGRQLVYTGVSGLRVKDGQPWENVTAFWPLREVHDRVHNFYKWEWHIEQDQNFPYGLEAYPEQVSYTFSDLGDLAERKVVFVHEPRIDATFDYQAGVRRESRTRLKAIEMHAPNPTTTGLVATYELSYEPVCGDLACLDTSILHPTYHSRLESVRHCDGDGVCKWAKLFEWQHAERPVFDTIDYDQGEFPDEYFNGSQYFDTRFVVADFDGDSFDDLLYDFWPLYQGAGVAHSIYMRFGSATGLGPANLLNKATPSFDALNLGLSRPFDIDGDGAHELLASFYIPTPFDTLTHQFYRFDKIQMAFVATSPPFDGIFNKENAPIPSVHFLDLNGDGRIDMLRKDTTLAGAGWVWRANVGGAFGPEQPSNVLPGEAETVRAGDFDADGRADFLVDLAPDSEGQSVRIHQPWFANGTFSQDWYGMPLGLAIFVDMNGDGLKDRIDPGKWYEPTLTWNNGNQFATTTTEPLLSGPYAEEQSDGIGYYQDSGHRVVDINGDGLDDIVAFTFGELTFYLAKHRWGQAQFQIYKPGLSGGSLHKKEGYSTSQIGDFNGDGLTDIVQVVKGTLRTLIQEADVGDVITAVWDEHAAHAREMVTYSAAWSDTPSAFTCTYPQKCIRRYLPVVKEHSVSQGEAVGAYRRAIYSYQDPRSDLRGRGFLGFGEVRQFDPDNGRETITTYDHTFVAGTRYPYALQPKTITTVVPIKEQWSGFGPPPVGTDFVARVSRLENTWAMRPLHGGATYFTYVSRWTSDEWEENVHIDVVNNRIDLLNSPNVTVLRHRQGSREVDDFANVTHSETKTTGGVRRFTDTSYDNLTNNWLIGLPHTTVSVVTDAQQSPVADPRRVDHHYSFTTGLLLSTVVEPLNPDLSHETKYYRDAHGLIDQIQEVVANEPDRWTYLAYDAEGVFPTQVYNDLLLYNVVLRHPAFGVPWLLVEPNGVKTSVDLDGFGRTLGMHPDGAEGVTYDFAADDRQVAGVPRGVAVRATLDGGGGEVTYHDELGRPWEHAVKGFQGEWIHDAVNFNPLGFVVRAYRPGVGAPSADSAEFIHDSLGRPIRHTTPDNVNTTFTHSMFESVATRPTGKHSVLRDKDDRPVVSRDDIDGTTVSTIIEYREYDLVKRIESPNANEVEFDYDKLGRRTLLDDPDAGVRGFEYNGYGEVIHAIDLLNTTTVWRDVLGRTVMTQDVEGIADLVWDQSPNGLGRISSTKSTDGTETQHDYDQFGNPSTTRWTVGGKDYEVEAKYDPLGRPEELRYPLVNQERFTVHYRYDPTTGYLRSAEDVTGGGSAPLYEITGRNVDLQLAGRTLGNGIQTSWSYFPTNGRVETIASAGSQVDWILKYTYDDVGNVATRTDPIADRVESFGYDNADRLRTWNLEHAGKTRKTEYAYQQNGFMHTVTVDNQVSDHYFADATRPHRLEHDTYTSYFYDELGRQTSAKKAGSSRAVAYTPFDLPRSITSTVGTTAAITTFEYDAFGSRVRKHATAGDDTVFIAGLYERRESATGTKHVFYVKSETGVLSEVVWDDSTPAAKEKRFIETDPLGSVGLVTDEAGAEKARLFYEPFGARIDAAGAPEAPPSTHTQIGFAGLRHDDELGLIDMRGRVYDPAQRRFLTPDPLISAPLFGQAYNRYNYARNNPLRYTDPTGFDVEVTEPTDGPDAVTGTFPESGQGPPPQQQLPPPPPNNELGKKKNNDGNVAASGKSDGDGLPPPAPADAGQQADDNSPAPAAQPPGPSLDTNDGAGMTPPDMDPPTSWKDDPSVQATAGYVAGFAIGNVPGGALAAKALPRRSQPWQIGQSFGEIAGGLMSIMNGVGIAGSGGVLAYATGGRGSGYAISAAAVGATMVVGGAVNIGAGLAGLADALSTGGNAGGRETPGGLKHTTHSLERANQRGFSDKAIDDIVRNNARNRVGKVDELGQKTWRYSDPRGNTVVTNEAVDEIVTVFSPAPGGGYIAKQ